MSNTTNSVDSLQATINRKAEVRLKNDLLELSNQISGSRLISGIRDGDEAPRLFMRKEGAKSVLAKVDGETSNKHVYLKDHMTSNPIENLFGTTKETYSKEPRIYGAFALQLFNYWLPFYIEEETRMFVERIEKIQEDVDYLNGSVANLECNQH